MENRLTKWNNCRGQEQKQDISFTFNRSQISGKWNPYFKSTFLHSVNFFFPLNLA